MSTITSPPREPHKLDVDSVVSQARNYTSLGETVSQTLTMAWRALKKMRRNPEQFFDVTFQPLLFTAMFAYIFGGAISGDVESYLPLIIPGILAQTALDRKSTRLNSSHVASSYAVFCLKKKITHTKRTST